MTGENEAPPRFLLSSLVSLLSLSSNLSRSLPSPALLDQLLSLIPLLQTPDASASSVQLITMIGGRVMTVAHLKRIFRLLRDNIAVRSPAEEREGEVTQGQGLDQYGGAVVKAGSGEALSPKAGLLLSPGVVSKVRVNLPSLAGLIPSPRPSKPGRPAAGPAAADKMAEALAYS